MSEQWTNEQFVCPNGCSYKMESLDKRISELEARWSFIKSDPESARHMLLLLSENKGTGNDFDRMIDRLVASKAEAQKETPTEG